MAPASDTLFHNKMVPCMVMDSHSESEGKLFLIAAITVSLGFK